MVRSVPLRSTQGIFILVAAIAVLNFFANHIKIEIRISNGDWVDTLDDSLDELPKDEEIVPTQNKSIDHYSEQVGTEQKVNLDPVPVPQNLTESEPPKYVPITCDRCFVRNYKYLNTPLPICTADEDPPDLVAVILSTPRDYKERDAMRQTYLRFAQNNTAPRFRYVFLLGAALTPGTSHAVNQEATKYRDILQQSFLESYKNLTLKTMMGLDYAVTTCPKARYILKVDSDVFMNIPRLMKLIDKTNVVTDIMGYCKWGNTPLRDRPNHKWYVSYTEYSQTRYPPLCEGPRYLVPMPVATAIVKVSPNVPFFRMEDVYVGMCLALTPYSIRRTNGFYNPTRFTGLKPEDLDCDAIRRMGSTHKTSANEMKMLWGTCYGNISLDLPQAVFY